MPTKADIPGLQTEDIIRERQITYNQQTRWNFQNTDFWRGYSRRGRRTSSTIRAASECAGRGSFYDHGSGRGSGSGRTEKTKRGGEW